MYVSKEVEKIIDMTVIMAQNANFELVVPELMLYVICQNEIFAQAFENCGGSVRELDYHLRTYIENYMECKDEADEGEPELSQDMRSVLEHVREIAQNSGKDVVELPHLLFAIYGLEESYAVYYMLTQGVERTELIQEMTILYEENTWEDSSGKSGSAAGRGSRSRRGNFTGNNGDEANDADEGSEMAFEDEQADDEPEDEEPEQRRCLWTPQPLKRLAKLLTRAARPIPTAVCYL